MTWKIVLACLGCLGAGFCGGWVTCAFLTIGKEPEIPKGMRTHCMRCNHHVNDHEYAGCQVQGCTCPNNFLHIPDEIPRTCAGCGHICNYHAGNQGCQVPGCGCPNTLEESLL